MTLRREDSSVWESAEFCEGQGAGRRTHTTLTQKEDEKARGDSPSQTGTQWFASKSVGKKGAGKAEKEEKKKE